MMNKAIECSTFSSHKETISGSWCCKDNLDNSIRVFVNFFEKVAMYVGLGFDVVWSYLCNSETVIDWLLRTLDPLSWLDTANRALGPWNEYLSKTAFLCIIYVDMFAIWFENHLVSIQTIQSSACHVSNNVYGPCESTSVLLIEMRVCREAHDVISIVHVDIG